MNFHIDKIKTNFAKTRLSLEEQIIYKMKNNRLIFLGIALSFTFFTSCHKRTGCPTNFSIEDVVNMLQQIF